MKIVSKFCFVLLTVIASVQLAIGQQKDIQKANQLYKDYAYIDAIKIYERIAKNGYENQELLERLGNSYYFNADYQNALTWYDKLFANNEYQKDAEYYYRYAQSLKSGERYAESDKVMKQFVELIGEDDSRAANFEDNRDYKEIIEQNSGRFEVVNLDVNTEYSEYGTAFYGDDVVFTADNASGLFRRTSKWTGDSFYNLYQAGTDSLQLTDKSSFSSDLTTRYNESTAVFTPDGNTVYFTRNNFINNKVGTNENSTILLKIFKAAKNKKGKWDNEVEMPFNSNIHSVAHPALSPDGKYLYFASDMKGTLGSSDIFRVEITKDGYGKPENLGSVINTAGRESFPFVSKDNILYYSSDGIPGLGGLDIFASKINEDGTFGKPVNIGRPGNSPDDDFCYVINSDTKIGYLSSNRLGGKGKDDIYSFYERLPLQFACGKYFHGIVKNADTNEVIPAASVVLSNRKMEQLVDTQSINDGTFKFADYALNCGDSEFYLKGAKEGFETAEVKVVSEGRDDIYYELLLKPRVAAVKEGDDLAKVFNIENIYFDFDKSNIRYDASVQLAKILEVMKEYPTMVIDVRSHTDSRGSDSYNMALSDRRAKSTVQWLISKGIEPSRISGQGYGESQLVNGCSNGVECTKEQHQANRRSEFIIVKM
ncbi:MAG: OmpA family protein [Capnocytophaga sp.]|nr:OmpA family protein [Capnocytophaga sp.]